MLTSKGVVDVSYIIKLDRIRKCLNGQHIIELDFELKAGELVIFWGPSGTGKSTALRIISGLEVADSGQVLFRGKPISQLSRSEIRDYRRALPLVPQVPVILPTSVMDNLTGMRAELARDEGFIERACQLFQAVGLDDGLLYHEKATELSVGQQYRICLVRALLMKPIGLMLDEPTAHLDHENKLKVEELIVSLIRSERLGVILVTHESQQVDRLRRGLTSSNISLITFGKF